MCVFGSIRLCVSVSVCVSVCLYLCVLVCVSVRNFVSVIVSPFCIHGFYLDNVTLIPARFFHHDHLE